jgi:hypothetical protein
LKGHAYLTEERKKLTGLSGLRDIGGGEKHNSKDKSKEKKSLGVTHFVLTRKRIGDNVVGKHTPRKILCLSEG